MNEKRLRVTIAKDGSSYKIETVSGFGNECVTEVNKLQVAIGGMVQESGPAAGYYDSEEEFVNIKNSI